METKNGEKKKISIMFLGAPEVGKTTLIGKFVGHPIVTSPHSCSDAVWTETTEATVITDTGEVEA